MPYNSHTPASDDRKRVQRSVKHPHPQPHLQRHTPESSEFPLRSSIALLGSPGLRARSNDHVRTAVMQRMQSSYGNRATRQFVQRASQNSPVAVQRVGPSDLDWLEGYISNRDREALEELIPETEPSKPVSVGGQPEKMPEGYITDVSQIESRQTSPLGWLEGYISNRDREALEELIPETEPSKPAPVGGQPEKMPEGYVTDVSQSILSAPVPVSDIPSLTSGLEPIKDLTGPKYRLVKKMHSSYEGEKTNLAEYFYKMKQEDLLRKQKKLQKGEISAEEYKKAEDLFNEWVKVNKINPEEVAHYKVQYLRSEQEREQYELTVDNGTIKQGKPPQVYDTGSLQSFFEGSGWAIFVMSEDGRIYSAPQLIGRFQHSSFFAGGALASAGEIRVENGRLIGISNKSGHYRPNWLFLVQVLQELRSRGVKLEGVQARVYGLDPDRPDKASDYPGGAAQFLADKELGYFEHVKKQMGKQERITNRQERTSEVTVPEGERSEAKSGGYLSSTSGAESKQTVSAPEGEQSEVKSGGYLSSVSNVESKQTGPAPEGEQSEAKSGGYQTDTSGLPSFEEEEI